MDRNRQTIEQLYSSFQRLDPDGMAGCYSPDAAFDDEVFSLRGKREVMGMWRMLCENVKFRGQADWKLEYSGVQADDDAGQARWDAHYRFSATGRLVHNQIAARFHFNPHGLITRHHDTFDFWKWSRQALGPAGMALGWTPLLRNKVRKQAKANLDRYLANAPAA